MLKKDRNLFSWFVVIAGLLSLMPLSALTVEIADAKELVVFEGQKVQVPEDVPDYSSWKANFPRLFPEGLIAVIYDNPATPDIKDDLTEMYDLENRLLSIGWYDEMGAYKMVLDSGLLTEEKSLNGVFTMIQDVDDTI
ncbi:MAG: hypothetical protein SVY10_02225 [Thermodesulfobacteriota bacterium]|nr:hypothetical protein [Thermodesulfobacteriota bacterium]